MAPKNYTLQRWFIFCDIRWEEQDTPVQCQVQVHEDIAKYMKLAL